jgi:holo-[acyl-carrier protein] synthase
MEHPAAVGIDIIEIARIRKALENHPEAFLEKIFTEEERSYCMGHRDPSPHLAARFAAKEAAVKALGVGFREGISWQDIWVRKDPLGKPLLELSSSLRKSFPAAIFLLSMSHDKSSAIAIVYAYNL